MSTALKPVTSDEFLLWAEGKEGRWELHDGAPVMMSPERLAAYSDEGACLVRTGRRGQTSKAAVRSLCRRRFSEDRRRSDFRAGRNGGLRTARPDDAIAITDPIIVVEVLSPSTAAIDHGRKLSGYFSLKSVEHYLILDPERRVVIHHKRGASDGDRDAGARRAASPSSIRPAFEVAVEALFPATTD